MKKFGRPRYVPPELRTGSEEQAAVVRVFRSVGATVYVTSTGRRTRATPGILDLIVVHPRFLILWDSKGGTGRLSKEQREFIALIEARSYRDVLTGHGDAETARKFLMTLVPPRFPYLTS